MTDVQQPILTEPRLSEIDIVPAMLDRTIPEEFIDYNGHLNVRFYMEIQLEGAARLFETLGMDTKELETSGRSTFAREHHIRYHAECMKGHRVTVHPVLVGRTERNLHLISYLVNQTTQQLASVIEIVMTHVDMRTRRPVEWGHWAPVIDAQIAARPLEPAVLLHPGPSVRPARPEQSHSSSSLDRHPTARATPPTGGP
ncbi:thioesterase family protein [Nocardioides sp. LML1-1-1.1]|uniref:thioesterase family protein n=1 Tax=Nocardioides sp. LML1-1-1.1 TaxID=3135248 RepID=UPI0034139DFE